MVHSSFVPFEKNDIILNVESIAKYALPLLDILDNEKNIKYRLTREHCTFLNGIYIKELKKLNRNLKDLVIVDNSPLAYAFDSDNGLPIKGWYDDKEDKELDKIFPVLEFLANTKDVRFFIHTFVSNNEINYDTANELIKNINEKNNLNIIGNNKTNDNKEDTERKAISVNIKLNNKKHKIKNNDENNISNKENSANNNNGIISKENNDMKINNNIFNNNYVSKMLYDKKDTLYTNNINNTNHNFNKKNSKNGKILANNYTKNPDNIKNIVIHKKAKEKITDSKTYNLLQRKKNSFRTGPKLVEKKMLIKNISTANNIHLKNNHNNYFTNNTKFPLNNNDNDFPMGLPLSNTTKTRPSSKTQIQYNINKKINKKIKKSKNKEHISLQKNISYDKSNTLNYNFNFINNKYRYTNLIEQLENRTMKSNCSLNNKSQTNSKSTKLFNAKNMLHKKKLNNYNKTKKLNHIRVSSSLIGKYQALIINNSVTDNKIVNTNNHVSRSKNTGNFINFAKKFQKPKTPKGGQFIFEKKLW